MGVPSMHRTRRRGGWSRLRRWRRSGVLPVLGITSLLLIGGAAILWAGGAGSGGPDVFEGVVDNRHVNPGTVVGVGVYDDDCRPVDPAHPTVTRCDAGIETDEYGVLNFNYVHDMHDLPCISPGEYVEVDILDASGAATVRRYGSPPSHLAP